MSSEPQPAGQPVDTASITPTPPTTQSAEAERAVWSTADQNDLPDASFAHIEEGGTKDAEGKTTPRSLRHLPYKDKDGKVDEAHVRNGLARISQTSISDAAKAAARQKLVAAAKQVGIEVGDKVGNDNERAAQSETVTPTPAPGSRAARVAEIQRAAAAEEADITRVTLPATVRIVDRERREFEVTATSEAKDSYKTIFGYEASKDAFQRWLRIGNIREMHAPVAVGRGLDATFDDENRRISVRGRVSRGAEPTWLKLEDGVLQGASIGASNVKWEQRNIGGEIVPYATYYDLVELSLVDNPSNPDAYGVTLIRSAEPNRLLLEDPTATPSPIPSPIPSPTLLPPPGLPGVVMNPQVPAGVPMVDALTEQVSLGALPNLTPTNAADTAQRLTDPTAIITQNAAEVMGAAAQEYRRSGWAISLEERAAREARQAEITAAGDAAEATLPAMQRGEDPVAFARMRANVRGAAEAGAIMAIRARERAEVERTAKATTQTAETARASVASQAAGSTPVNDAEMAKGGALGVAAGAADTTPHQADINPRGPILSDETTATMETPALGGPALGAQATSREETHDHLHEHRADDGTTFTHAHDHDHASPGHDHLHTWRNGQPTDTRLGGTVAVSTLRAPFVQNGKETDIPAATILRPTSGTGQAALAKPQSAIMATTPAKVGQPVLYNTEDVEAVNFGVPEEADGRATDDDEIVLNPDDFHPGGHESAVGDLNKPTTATSAHSGAGEPLASRPPEPSRIPRDLKTPGEGRSAKTSPKGTARAAGATPSQPMSNAISTQAIPDDPSNPAMVYTQTLPTGGKAAMTSAEMASDNKDRDEEPGYAENEGNDGDADDKMSGSSVYTDAPATPITYPAGSGPTSTSAVNDMNGFRVADPAIATRKGARLSAESRDAVHGMRDGALGSVKLACEHCGCPECQSLLAVINGGMLDATGQHAAPGDEAADTKSDTGLFGELRATRAAMNATFTRQVTQLRAEMAEFTDAMNTALGDLQLTLSDHQRGYAAQTQRAVTAQFTSQLDALTTRLNSALPDMETRMQATTHAALQPLVQQSEGLAASVAEVKAVVERVEQQPLQHVVAPSLALADKRLALDTPSRGGASSDEAAFLTTLGQKYRDNPTAATDIATRLTILANRR